MVANSYQFATGAWSKAKLSLFCMFFFLFLFLDQHQPASSTETFPRWTLWSLPESVAGGRSLNDLIRRRRRSWRKLKFICCIRHFYASLEQKSHKFKASGEEKQNKSSILTKKSQIHDWLGEEKGAGWHRWLDGDWRMGSQYYSGCIINNRQSIVLNCRK